MYRLINTGVSFWTFFYKQCTANLYSEYAPAFREYIFKSKQECTVLQKDLSKKLSYILSLDLAICETTIHVNNWT